MTRQCLLDPCLLDWLHVLAPKIYNRFQSSNLIGIDICANHRLLVGCLLGLDPMPLLSLSVRLASSSSRNLAIAGSNLIDIDIYGNISHKVTDC